jgi:hypothetical protein
VLLSRLGIIFYFDARALQSPMSAWRHAAQPVSGPSLLTVGLLYDSTSVGRDNGDFSSLGSLVVVPRRAIDEHYGALR